jgi:hypothetical protein
MSAGVKILLLVVAVWIWIIDWSYCRVIPKDEHKHPAYFRIFPSKTPSTMADNTTTPVGGTIQHGGMLSTSITVQEGTAVVAEFQLQFVAQDLSVNTVVENGVLAAATTSAGNSPIPLVSIVSDSGVNIK